MALSYQDAYTKFQTLSGSINATDLVQGKQDINIGYSRFNAAISRYFTRKQAFTDLVAQQRYYQTPVDAVRVSEVVVTVSGSYAYPLKQIRDEYEWRELLIVPGYASNFLKYYFIYGNDQIGLYPLPSQTITAGLRFVYQPQDVYLTHDDYTTGNVSISNGATAVTGAGTSWYQDQHGDMQLQVTDGSDGNWYEIVAVNSTTSLTLKTPYVGPSVRNANYRLGQLFIFPPEYDDVPIDYALARFFESRNNPSRAKYHRDNYQDQVTDALEKYASSSTSHVITDEMDSLNLWTIPPQPGM